MKFSIGEEVRIKKDLELNKNYGKCRVGKEAFKHKGRIIQINNYHSIFQLYITNIDGEDLWLSEEMIEKIGEHEISEKTFSEIMSLKKEGQVWMNKKENAEILITENGILIQHIDKKPFDGIVGIALDNSIKYKLKRREYTFPVAFKAYEEGKEIESLLGYRYKKTNNKDTIFSLDFDEVRNNWYIND